MQPFRNGVVGVDGRDEVARYEPRALMYKLIESVLPVGARLAPDNRPSGVAHAIPMRSHRFPVALHVALLEVGRESMHVLVVGEERVRLGAPHVDIPNAQHGEDHRDLGTQFIPST